MLGAIFGDDPLTNVFKFKDHIPIDLISSVIYKFQCGLCNESYHGECVRHLNLRKGKYIGISPITKKITKPRNGSAGDLLFCNCSA